MTTQIEKPWLKPNGTPLPDSYLKTTCKTWNTATWTEYLDWFDSPCREVIIHTSTYDQICEGRAQSIYEDLGPTSDDGLSNFCERMLNTLSHLESKVLRLYFMDGRTELEIATVLKKSQTGINLVKTRGISKLSAQLSDAEMVAIHIMKGLDLEIEFRTEESISQEVCSSSGHGSLCEAVFENSSNAEVLSCL